MNVIPFGTAEIVEPPKQKEYKPLKIAIITHFSRTPSSYSPGSAVKALIKMLSERGHHPIFFTQEGSPLTEEEVGSEIRRVVTKFKREKNVVNEDAKNKFIDVLRENLTTDIDICISFDMMIDDCVTYREAMKDSGVNIPWLHWARSGVGTPIDFSMPHNSRYIYMNKADAKNFAIRIGVGADKIRVVNNIKDPMNFWRCDDITKMIVNKYRLWEKDIIQTLAVCSTRTSAKGLDDILATFGALKKLGNKVALILANSNGRRRVEELKNIQKTAEHFGLNENDFIITSLLADDKYHIESEVPNYVVSELLKLSNLLVVATRAEVAPQFVLEGSLCGNLVVMNDDLPLLKEFCTKDSVLFWPFTSHQNINYSNRSSEDYLKLAKKIHGQIHSNKADKQMRYVWRNYNSEAIYHQLMDVIMELIDDYKNNKV